MKLSDPNMRYYVSKHGRGEMHEALMEFLDSENIIMDPKPIGFQEVAVAVDQDHNRYHGFVSKGSPFTEQEKRFWESLFDDIVQEDFVDNMKAQGFPYRWTPISCDDVVEDDASKTWYLMGMGGLQRLE